MWNQQIKDALDYFFDMDNPHFSALARIKHQRDLLRVSMDEEADRCATSSSSLIFRCMEGIPWSSETPDNQASTASKSTRWLSRYSVACFVIWWALRDFSAVARAWCRHKFALWRQLDPTSSRFARRTSRDCTKWLLNHGADVNSQEKDGWTPLHLAGDNLEACRMLLEHNAEVDSRDNEGLTPFLRACKNERSTLTFCSYSWTTMRMCDVCDDKGNTPLHFAAKMVFSRLLRFYSSATRMSIPRTTTDLPLFFLHQSTDTLMLCSYCWTTMPICICATPMATLHCIAQRLEASSRLLGYYSSSMWRSIPGTRRDRPHYT
jgi:hypothetical protein